MRFFTACILALATTPISAQQPWSIGARGHYGFLWAHRPAAWILVEGHAGATELFAERRVDGDRAWHRSYGLPRYGVLLLHTRMANAARIGEAIGVAPYLSLPLLEGNRLSLSLRVGWGLGYVSKPYDRRENTRQIAIGSRFNGALQLMPELRYDEQRLGVQLGLGINHWSNGSAKQPNLGLNFLSLSLGASYALGVAAPQRTVPDTRGYERERREFSVVGAFGMSESGRPLNGQHSVYALSGHASWRVGGKGTLGGGVDVFNKGDLPTVLPALDNRSRAELTQAGAHFGGSLLMGRGELLFQFGAYAYTPAPDDAPVYQRLGMRYRLGKRLLASACLKTHFATADHWEFGIGYRWH